MPLLQVDAFTDTIRVYVRRSEMPEGSLNGRDGDIFLGEIRREGNEADFMDALWILMYVAGVLEKHSLRQ